MIPLSYFLLLFCEYRRASLNARLENVIHVPPDLPSLWGYDFRSLSHYVRNLVTLKPSCWRDTETTTVQTDAPAAQPSAVWVLEHRTHEWVFIRFHTSVFTPYDEALGITKQRKSPLLCPPWIPNQWNLSKINSSLMALIWE